MSSADLIDAKLTGAVLTGTDLSEAKLLEEQLRFTIGNLSTKLRPNFRPPITGSDPSSSNVGTRSQI